MAFPARPEYESFIYGLIKEYPAVRSSTLHLYSVSSLTVIVEGDLYLDNGLRLRVLEVLDFKKGEIQSYSYAVYRNNEKIRWYDPQPHPENTELAVTFPHHYHEPPRIKQNRLPAPGVSFTSPNIPTLIADCLELGERLT